jgi:hypothetical protein
MRGEVRVFTREHGALQVWRDALERHPYLFAARLLALPFRFPGARIHERS